MTSAIPFEAEGVRGFLHEGAHPCDGLVLTHGAGGDCNAPLLVALADALQGRGVTALRCDLPFRQQRPSGPPRPGDAAKDREGLAAAVAALRALVGGRIGLGGQSYGGRQATMLAAEKPDLVEALLVLSYPLHPPGKPDRKRTAHFPTLRTSAMFVHGSRDPFGSIEEMEAALKLIPAPHTLTVIAGAGHDLKRGRFDLGPLIGGFLQVVGNRNGGMGDRR
jgi:hypothetical protein